jgi:hypothetical protein
VVLTGCDREGLGDRLSQTGSGGWLSDGGIGSVRLLWSAGSNYSVFAASAGGFALATAKSYCWSLDALLDSAARRPTGTLAAVSPWAHGAADTSASRGHEPMEPAGRDRERSEGTSVR